MTREAPVHIVPYDPQWPDQLWKERLAFRDCLRSHPDVAREYAELKYRLAEQYRFDREAYTEAKSEFIQRVLGKAEI